MGNIFSTKPGFSYFQEQFLVVWGEYCSITNAVDDELLSVYFFNENKREEAYEWSMKMLPQYLLEDPTKCGTNSLIIQRYVPRTHTWF